MHRWSIKPWAFFNNNKQNSFFEDIRCLFIYLPTSPYLPPLLSLPPYPPLLTYPLKNCKHFTKTLIPDRFIIVFLREMNFRYINTLSREIYLLAKWSFYVLYTLSKEMIYILAKWSIYVLYTLSREMIYILAKWDDWKTFWLISKLLQIYIHITYIYIYVYCIYLIHMYV